MKKLVILTTLVLILAAVVPILPTAEDAQIYDKTLRLHVIASSDKEEDQAVKLRVRDAVLALLEDDLARVTNR
ncbi:MAG: stage II sporulation protein R, partial [Clostridia bacterium]|nr:stage II sporulation protein R [Clostridia bacterium]